MRDFGGLILCRRVSALDTLLGDEIAFLFEFVHLLVIATFVGRTFLQK